MSARTRSTASLPRHVAARLLLALAFVGGGCHTRANYLHPEGPRSAGTHALPAAALPARLDQVDHAAPVAQHGAGSPDRLRVVSFNLKHGREVDAAIQLWAETPRLWSAEVVLLQEMDGSGVDAIAQALGYEYVYYPASHRRSGRDFGNAILTRGTIVSDEKVILSHANPVNRQRRVAVRANIEVRGQPLHVYSVHTETPVLGLAKREVQVDEIVASVPPGGPCLIGGDLNTMSARSLQRFEETFAAAGFERASEDSGVTLNVGPLGFVTDHVFARDLDALASGTVSSSISDHEPLWVDFAWSPLPDTTAPPWSAGSEALGSTGATRGVNRERTRALARFPQEPTPVRQWMKEHGWVSKRQDPSDFELEEGRLHLKSDGDSVLIGTERGFPVNVDEWPRIRFRLRVEQLPSGADLARKRTDDAAFRLFVAFDRGGGWFSPPDTIGYAWTAEGTSEAVVQSPHFKRVKYLPVGSGSTLEVSEDGWVTIERDLAADYTRAFGADKGVPKIEGIALKCDSNNTGGPASAWLSNLELVTGGGL